MNISKILINHMTEPIGFQLDNLRIEFTVEAEQFTEITKQLTIWTDNYEAPVYQSKQEPFETNYFDVPLTLIPRTRYHVEIAIRDTNHELLTKESFFETGKMDEPFQADWIAHPDNAIQNTLFQKKISVKSQVAKARLYATGLGIYEAYINGEKVGDEYLTPGVTAYDQWIQVQTYDVTAAFQKAADHELFFTTGDGWYKGTLGFDGGMKNIYGDQQCVIGEFHVTYEDGQTEIISTDSSWVTTSGKVTKSEIYYGEDLNDTLTPSDWQSVILLDQNKALLQDRLSLPIKIMERLPIQEILETPAGEQVLDFGQNQTGWLEFYNREPKGTKLVFQMGEILQEDNFYRENLREARASFVYISDGEEKWVRPHFTFYGYRYVKVEGNTQALRKEDYQAAVLYSEMATTGEIKTTNSKVNRLFQNILWGQKSNFLDIPTDCPQRDERLGWTGDAEVFSKTAALNMNVFPFFKKYAKDIAIEQQLHDGMVPMYAPAMGNSDGGAAVWGDAATIIPWNMYQIYGDSAILRQNYTAMKDWVAWIQKNSKSSDLWTGTFQFGDWLALDGENPALPTGKTEEDFIASVYYYYSNDIIAQTAEILNFANDATYYREQAQRIKEAIVKEYITANGRLAIDTQTAYAIALYFELVPQSQRSRVAKDLVTRLKKDNDHLKTGFVGTPFICQVLSNYGYHKLATKIFLLEDFPSWLYAVNLGATTVWERWNSILPDGSMNPEGMNSLNHYSFGAIMEWAYSYLLGIKPAHPGYQEINFSPLFDYRLKQVNGHFDTTYGTFAVSYQIEADSEHTIKLNLTVPFGTTVHVDLPRGENGPVTVNNQEKNNGRFSLTCGTYEIAYVPSENYVEHYNSETPAAEIMADELLVQKIDAIDPVLDFFRADPAAIKGGLGTMSLSKLNTLLPFIQITSENLAKINDALASTPILSEREEISFV
ncbi:family 78 glycoside hydrolase catalytic domain [Enterococcus avium]|uniref:alpha-L-rhamnosidase n=1 Tax=Enterococcus avium TaxID=33945 RepID=A0ABD5F5N1_ENTAV|nr:family 78 glycoside hydrolase catalytic domain [Enterococcus avium]MDT2397265.1 family 78 glycoside hydrolase catalytic domain [Enterococcus avium]MDT2435503.1 family 78 glycoside hydrolase catalytic domain [Enterococcus avium]MDT2448078.1 family 78 glycoside hydrolase catalytic domain [Enterococcus avium]MDT2464685.1 family 78 glycoside hydrolase catalytic domain [Enterococcus avium]MDT2481821.1 family 78 glycoside hydrolase catalytic domain [Enterococcus avium]